MALVTVTGNVTDITGKPDPDTLVFSAPSIRKHVLSTRDKRVVPNAATGEFSVQLEEGPATVIVRGKPYKFTAAEGDLFDLIELGLLLPPATNIARLRQEMTAWAAEVGDLRYTTPAALNTAMAGLKSSLLGGVDAAYDTLKEVADKLAANDSAVGSIMSAIGERYLKPTSGIPRADLVQGVRDSLDKADASIAKTVADNAYAPLAQSVRFAPAWQSGTAYPGSWIVVRSGAAYIGTDVPSRTTFTAADWTALGGGGSTPAPSNTLPTTLPFTLAGSSGGSSTVPATVPFAAA